MQFIDFFRRDKTHVEWCKAWVQTLTDLNQYVRQHHTTGLVWAKTANKGPGGPPPPPPPSMMPMPDIAPLNVNDERSALFAEINQGENITKSEFFFFCYSCNYIFLELFNLIYLFIMFCILLASFVNCKDY